MLTKDIKTTIDNARDILVGKLPSPQSQIEQITIAMIYKFMDDMDLENVKLGGERNFFIDDLENYAWSKIMSNQLGNEVRMNLYTEALEKLPLAPNIPKLFRDIFKNAYLPFRDGQTLKLFLNEINDLSYENSENLGNGFEYLLSIMGSQGDAGQFRTPRHIIDFIVKVVKPAKTDTILDPACGTAGFLISAYKYIMEVSQKQNELLTPKEKTTLAQNIVGYDISPDMVKLALVNMYLHNFKDPKISEYDTLTNTTKWDDYFDVVLANPPFMTPKGGIQPHNKFSIKANRSEVLFVDYIAEHINSNGRAGVVVPEGIVFQSANAYKDLRKKLIDENYLYAVVSLPSGVFNPYSGVKTSILFMDKQLAKRTDKILFVEIKNDGYDLGAQRREIDKNDLPQALEIINKWQDIINNPVIASESEAIQSDLITVVEKSKLAENGEYNLTASRYKETKDYSNCKWDMVKIGEVLQYEQPTNYIVESENYSNDYKIPVLTAGQTFILGYTNENNGVFKDELPVIIFDDFTTATKYVDFPFKVKSSAMKILKADNNTANIRYIYYIMQIIKFNSSTHKRYWISEYSNIQIPLPPLEVQEEIVKELDSYQAIIDGAQKVVDNWKPTLPINPNWEKVKLEEIATLINGRAYRQEELLNEGKYRVLRVGNFFSSKEWYYSNLELDPDKYCENGDLLYAWSASFGPKIWGGDKTIYHYHIWKVILKNNIDKKFLYYLLLQDSEYIKSSGHGITMVHVTKGDMEKREFYIPSLEEQQEIVAKIEEEEKAVEECKKLIKLHQTKINNKIKSIWGEND